MFPQVGLQRNAKAKSKLILRKIIEIVPSFPVPTICHISKLKCPKFDFGWDSATDPVGGAYSTSPIP